LRLDFLEELVRISKKYAKKEFEKKNHLKTKNLVIKTTAAPQITAWVSVGQSFIFFGSCGFY
jgi:hypothetical protein